MSGEKGSTYANDLLKLVFNSTALSWNAATNLYLSLHSADPGAGGSQTTSEVTTSAYSGYTRVAATRSGSTAFTISTNSMTLTSAISFPSCSGGTGVSATFFAIGISSTGAGEILYTGPISPTIAISSGVTPQLTTATYISEA